MDMSTVVDALEAIGFAVAAVSLAYVMLAVIVGMYRNIRSVL